MVPGSLLTHGVATTALIAGAAGVGVGVGGLGVEVAKGLGVLVGTPGIEVGVVVIPASIFGPQQR